MYEHLLKSVIKVHIKDAWAGALSSARSSAPEAVLLGDGFLGKCLMLSWRKKF